MTLTSERGSDISCGTYGCVLGGRVIWGPRREPPERVFAAMHAPMPTPRRTYIDRLRSMIPAAGIEPTRWACSPAANAVARGGTPAAAAPAPSDARSYSSGGWLEEQPDTANTTIISVMSHVRRCFGTLARAVVIRG